MKIDAKMKIAGALAFSWPCVGAAVGAAAPKPPEFAVCGVCHKVNPGEPATVGPNLWGVGGRRAGTGTGFTYSPAMKNSGVIWTRSELVGFLTSPAKKIPGTNMAYKGQKDPGVAGKIADYLLSLRGAR